MVAFKCSCQKTEEEARDSGYCVDCPFKWRVMPVDNDTQGVMTESEEVEYLRMMVNMLTRKLKKQVDDYKLLEQRFLILAKGDWVSGREEQGELRTRDESE